MQLSLMGITSLETITKAQILGVQNFSFDLRPRSFNFVQGKKIKAIITEVDNADFYLTFENEKDFMVQNLQELISLPGKNLFLEFTGTTEIEHLEKMQQNYSWHYQSLEKIKNINKTQYLKRIILDHQFISQYQASGELFGFLQFFRELDQDFEFHLKCDWDTELIGSAFEYLHFKGLVFEINSKIEKSYQTINHELMLNQLSYYINLFK